MRYFYILALFSLCCTLPALTVTENGKTQAEIVIPERKSPVIVLAAQELQLWIKNISGAELPIYQKPSKKDNVKFLLGSDYAKAFAGDLKELSGSDGCAVRSQGKNVYMFGAQDRGALNAVLWLLDRNTDLIFARPVDGTVYSKNPDLDFKQLDFLEKPTWKTREFGLILYQPTELWAMRSFQNTHGMHFQKRFIFLTDNLYFTRQLRYEFGELLANDKYFKDHPEYYAWQEGRRRPYQHYGPQLCYTSEAGREAMVKELMRKLANDMTEETGIINFSFGDTWSLCECPDCRKPIKLANDTIIKPSDEAFRSTQFYIYMNKITADIVKKYPQVTVSKLAYLYAAVPPKVKLHPQLRPVYCPYPKDNKQSVFGPKNKKWAERSYQWAKISKITGIYEYFGDSSEFPRPISDVACKSLREWNRIGLDSYIYSEWVTDQRNERDMAHDNAGAWDVSGMEFWTLSRLFWNSKLDVKELKQKYLQRAYREAAKPMADYYETLRKVWYDDPRISFWNDNQVYSAYHYIRKNGIEKKMREYLSEAEKTAQHPVSKRLVQLHRKRFEYWMKASNKFAPEETLIPLVNSNSNHCSDFNALQWNKGARIELRRNSKNVETRYYTEVYLLHDRLNLYVKFVCKDPGIASLKKLKASPVERYFGGDKVSLFIAPGKLEKNINTTYYHFMVNPDGLKYDAKGYTKEWNSDFKSAALRKADSWEAIMTIPLNKAGIVISKYNKVKLLLTRTQYDSSTDEDIIYTCSDRKEHEPLRFPEAVLKE